MKLLIATQALPGLAGAPLHIADLCHGFRRAGHDVSAFTLQPGPLSDTLKAEGFPIFSLSEYRALSKEPFDLVYLHHATPEVLLGLMFAGKLPIVRGYIGKGSALASPVNGNFSSAATYLSEGVRETMIGMDRRLADVPSMISRNVYDESQFPRGVALKEPPHDKPNFAVVSNHLESGLAEMLKDAAEEGLLRFTHFGYPHNSVPITAEILTAFDAVITIGRTVLLAAAMGIPVYMYDVYGVEGWLTRAKYAGSQRHSFSGRLGTVEDRDSVQQQLLDTSQWPTTDDLSWLCERVEADHALYRRVEQLEAFFAEVIEKAPPPVEPPEGYAAVLHYIESRGQETRSVPGDAHRVSEMAKALREARERGRAQAQRIRRLQEQLEQERARA